MELDGDIMAAFPGIKVLTLGPVFKGIGEITKAKLIIPNSRITGPTPKFYMKTGSGDDWEEVQNGTEYTFTNSGTELYIQIVGSGCTISCKGIAGELAPGVICKVTELT